MNWSPIFQVTAVLGNRIMDEMVASISVFTVKITAWSDILWWSLITKTCPCNVYPLEPYFYIVKLGFAGVYLFFLFLLQNIDCGYSLEPPRRGGSNVYPQSMF